MNGAFYIGATGLHAQQSALDVVANNIANINTPAFKRSEVRFSELIAAVPVEAPSLSSSEVIGGLSGVTVDTSRTVFTQGQLRLTGGVEDLAIDGQGFVALLGPGGQTQLWRGGAFKVNADGYLATANGTPLKALVSVPEGAGSVVVQPDGTVQAIMGEERTAVDIGQIDLVLVKDMDSLSPIGGGLYGVENEMDMLAVAPGEEGSGTLVQGSIETSNVELSDEMVTLLLMQRAFAASAQLIQAGDQLMSIANNLRR